MPRIPTYERQQGIPGQGPAVRANEQALSVVPRETARAGQALTRAGLAFQVKLMQARQARQLGDASTGAMKAIMDKEQELIARTDYQSFVPEFEGRIKDVKEQYRESIKDPEVWRAFERDFDKWALQRSVQVQSLAHKQEIDASRAKYFDNMVTLRNMQSGADAETKEKILNQAKVLTAGAERAGYITREAAGKRLETFAREWDSAEVKALIHDDPQDALDKLLANEWDLDQTDRVRLIEAAERRLETRKKEMVRAEEDRARAEEEAVKTAQETRALDLTMKALKGELSEAELYEAGDDRLITRTALTSIHRILDRDEPAGDDEAVKTALIDDIYQGRGSREDILEALDGGLITHKTAQNLLVRVSQVKEEDILKTPEYKDGARYIKNNLKTTGIMSAFDPDEGPRIERALDEFTTRVRQGEDLRAVRDDIVDRYRPQDLGVSAYPSPIYGTKEDPGEAYRRTKAAYESGEIDYRTFRREIETIYALSQIEQRKREQKRQADLSKETLKDFRKRVNKRD